ncbi:MAG: 50S ribosomal protein L28 [Tissierellia bacterium]|nr:50S ribosomal protein L28 [Tissierellia bacterium]
MSRTCDVCGKTKTFGNKITFSHRKINRSWAPNIRRVRALVNGSVKRINVCTRCLKSGRVTRPM